MIALSAKRSPNDCVCKAEHEQDQNANHGADWHHDRREYQANINQRISVRKNTVVDNPDAASEHRKYDRVSSRSLGDKPPNSLPGLEPDGSKCDFKTAFGIHVTC